MSLFGSFSQRSRKSLQNTCNNQTNNTPHSTYAPGTWISRPLEGRFKYTFRHHALMINSKYIIEFFDKTDGKSQVSQIAENIINSSISKDDFDDHDEKQESLTGYVSITEFDASYEWAVVKSANNFMQAQEIMIRALSDCNKHFKYTNRTKNCEEKVRKWFNESNINSQQGYAIGAAGCLGILSGFAYYFSKLNPFTSNLTDATAGNLLKCKEYVNHISDLIMQTTGNKQLASRLSEHAANLTATTAQEVTNISSKIIDASIVGTEVNLTQVINNDIGMSGDLGETSAELAVVLTEASKELKNWWKNRPNKGKWINKAKGFFGQNENVSTDIVKQQQEVRKKVIDIVKCNKEVVKTKALVNEEMVSKSTIGSSVFIGAAVAVAVIAIIGGVYYYYYKRQRANHGELMQYKLNEKEKDLMSIINGKLDEYKNSNQSEQNRFINDITNCFIIDLNKKYEFQRWYSSNFDFGSKQLEYYRLIAEYGYNDIVKMMKLDDDMLKKDCNMLEKDAEIFMDKMDEFIDEYRVFERCICRKLKMKKYFVRFENEGILTWNIFNYRFQEFKDLVHIVGVENINDAKRIYNCLPNDII